MKSTTKAPGKSFREGMSLIEIIHIFPNDNAAEAWFTEVRWPEGPFCPYCGTDNVLSGAKHKTMPFRCRDKGCRKRFSVRTGTVMQASNLGFQVWAVAIYLILTNLKGVASMKLHRDLKITQRSAWHLAHRIRRALESGEGLFSGPVEVDETYVGGKEKNKPVSKRRKKGRGPVGKIAVAGVKDRSTNRVTAAVVEHTDKETLQGFIRENVQAGATVYTDDALAYHNMDGFEHSSVRHSVGEYVREKAHTNGIESFWSMLKRGYHGTHHKMSPKHLGRYVAEFAGRHGIREMDTIDQMKALVRGMEHKTLRYRDLVRPTGRSAEAV